MSRSALASARSALLTLFAMAAPLGLHAQEPARDPQPDTTAAAPAAPRTVAPEDYGRFERLGRTVLSPDGRWLAAEISRVSEENELRLRAVANPDSVLVIANGSGSAFTDDGRWFGALEGVGKAERERLQKANKPVRSTFVLVNLATGDTTRVAEIAGFSFSADGRFAALRRYAPEGNRDHSGVDVVVHELATGTPTLLGNVAEHAWADAGAWLAVVIDAKGMAGNGVQLFDAASGRLRTLESGATRFEGLTWREDAADLAVLRRIARDATGEDVWTDTAHVALAFTGVDRADGGRRHEMGPAGLPAGMRIPSFGNLRWDDGGRMLLVGVDAREPKVEACSGDEARDAGEAGAGDAATDAEADAEPDAPCRDEIDDADKPTLELWHAADVDIVPTQKVRANMERRRTRLAVWHLDASELVVVQDPVFENVTPVEGTMIAFATDETPYDAERMFGPGRQDVYRVDLRTGAHERVLEGEEFYYGPSPGGRYLLTWDGTDFWSHDLTQGTRTNLTAAIDAGFVNEAVDVVVKRKPPHGNGGWFDGDVAVVLYDEFDAWRVSPDGRRAERITDGRAEGIRYRRVYLDFDDREIDPAAPLHFSTYNDDTEEWGYARATRPGRMPELLVHGPHRYSGLAKADDADVYMFTKQSFEDSPDAFVGGPMLRDAVQVTRTNPFQDEYLWGRSELVAFTNTWGDELQGALFYPAGYEPGRQYPMIVYIYEIVANGIRSYHVPSERDYYDFQAWVQNGYFVFQPDIVYRDRDPGLSAKAALEPAVAAVVATGMVDPDRVGLIGHSWGGYQTTFMSTTSDVFAAAVAGAPLTNLFSMYLSIYWNSGGTDARIFEISQGRMEVPFWEDEDAYRRNSPVFHIESMNTPLLMAQGTEDGAVDFNQGVEFYNAARREGKDFVFLVYNGENHGFTQEPNQRDYHRRIIEWFDHYLKGAPPAPWITAGVPYLDQLERAKGSR